MKHPLKSSLIALTLIHLTGCSLLSQQDADIEYISYMPNVSLSVGESAIVHGGYTICGIEPRSWSEISHRLQKPKTGYFSGDGIRFMRVPECGGQTLVRAVKFTATKIGSESITVLGDPMTITVSNGVNFLQSNEVLSVPAPPKPKNTFFGVELEIGSS